MQLANIAYGAARSDRGKALGKLFMALARAAERHMYDLNDKQLANTGWAFATAGELDVSFFRASARAVERRVGDFNT